MSEEPVPFARGTRLAAVPLTALSVPGSQGPDRASTPDHASLDITGDIDIRVEATIGDWFRAGGVALARKYIVTGNQRSWAFWVEAGNLWFQWSQTGLAALQSRTSSVTVSPPPGGRFAVRVTFVADDDGRNTTRFWTAASIAGPWTQLGDAFSPPETQGIFASTAPLFVGNLSGDIDVDNLDGLVHHFELRAGINGPVVARPDFTAQNPGATQFTDGAARTWTVEGDAQIVAA